MWALNGLLRHMSNGWSMELMPPGIMTRSVPLSVRRAFPVQWPRKESSTSIDRCAYKAPSLFFSDCSNLVLMRFIQELSYTSTTIPGGNGVLGRALPLNIRHRCSLVPSPKAHLITVQRSLVFLPVSTLIEFELLFSRFMSIGILKYTGVWAALPT